jgi:DNA-nicking Smr family endonuclease
MSRKLTPEEEALWHKVRRTVTPKDQSQTDMRAAMGKSFMAVPPETSTTKVKPRQPVQMNLDKKTRRGRVEVGAKIDLHDLPRDQAFDHLRSRLPSMAARGVKCALIITGKGPRLMGVIRQAFPEWINHASLRPYIASYAPASIKHGGSGAWYVFLRKP